MMTRTKARRALTMAAMLFAAMGVMRGEGLRAQEASEEEAAAPLWVINCSNAMTPEVLTCEFSQSLFLTNSQTGQSQRLAVASFVRAAGSEATEAVFLFPQDVNLSTPVSLAVDGGDLGKISWQNCDNSGCYARGPVAAEWLTAMRSGKDLVATVVLVNNQELAMSFQLNGFTKADAMMP